MSKSSCASVVGMKGIFFCPHLELIGSCLEELRGVIFLYEHCSLKTSLKLSASCVVFYKGIKMNKTSFFSIKNGTHLGLVVHFYILW